MSEPTDSAERLPKEMGAGADVKLLKFEDIKIDPDRMLGKGAFSQVFEGELHGSKVAVKRMRIPAALSKDTQYLQTELRILSCVAAGR